VFLRETIDKEVRLSYLERIQRTLPEEYFAVFPLKPEVEQWKLISGTSRKKRADADRFGGGDDSEKLVEALRARDDSAVAEYLDSNPNSGELLVAATLFISHETPYSHTLPLNILELIKQHTSPSSLIGTIMSFWRQRPSTGTVLALKYVDLGLITLNDVVAWLLQQNEWMRHLWGWEVIQLIYEKAGNQESKLVGSEMQEDSNGVNGSHKNERREILETIISDVDGCFERQSELDREWVKEWFAMVVRLFRSEVNGLGGSGWVGEILSAVQEYQRRVADVPM